MITYIFKPCPVYKKWIIKGRITAFNRNVPYSNNSPLQERRVSWPHVKYYNDYFTLKMRSYYHYYNDHSPKSSKKWSLLEKKYRERKCGVEDGYNQWRSKFTAMEKF